MKHIQIKHKVISLYFLPKEKSYAFHTKHTDRLNEQIPHVLERHQK